MICSENGERREEIVKPCCAVVIVPGFQVHSALYGDGKERYADVTTVVKDWVSKQSWPDNWEEILYATRKPRMVPVGDSSVDNRSGISALGQPDIPAAGVAGLKIHEADYGIPPEQWIDVREQLQSLVKDNSLDIIVNNSTLTPGQNPFRGRKKKLTVTYSFGGLEHIVRHVEEKDWLIIGPVQVTAEQSNLKDPVTGPLVTSLSQLPPMTAPALNDYLIRKFSISPQRLRGPMPIELRDFHRNDLARLFAELGFKRGAEIGVAEGNYSEVLLKANPECELLLVDPWHHYSDNPQGKSKEKHEFAYTEMVRKVMGYQHVKVKMQYSMDAVRDVEDNSLDFVYIDGAHSFNYVLMDIICWSKKVRSGGIIALDDYFFIDRKRWGAGVVEAVQSFTSAHQINPWFICDAHRSVDAFWVNP